MIRTFYNEHTQTMQKQNFYANAYMLSFVHYGVFLGIPLKTCNTLKRTICVSA